MKNLRGTAKAPLFLVAAALSVVVLTVPGCGGGGASAAPVSVKMSEFKFEPVQLTATTGQTLKLTLQNSGTVQHDFAVKGLDNVASPKVQPGQSLSFQFTPSKAGTYEVICTEPGHEQGGMKGTLTVK